MAISSDSGEADSVDEYYEEVTAKKKLDQSKTSRSRKDERSKKTSGKSRDRAGISNDKTNELTDEDIWRMQRVSTNSSSSSGPISTISSNSSSGVRARGMTRARPKVAQRPRVMPRPKPLPTQRIGQRVAGSSHKNRVLSNDVQIKKNLQKQMRQPRIENTFSARVKRCELEKQNQDTESIRTHYSESALKLKPNSTNSSIGISNTRRSINSDIVGYMFRSNERLPTTRASNKDLYKKPSNDNTGVFDHVDYDDISTNSSISKVIQKQRYKSANGYSLGETDSIVGKNIPTTLSSMLDFKIILMSRSSEAKSFGLIVYNLDGFLVVVSLKDDGIASKSGVRIFDELIEINGVSTIGVSAKEAVGMISGAGLDCVLKINSLVEANERVLNCPMNKRGSLCGLSIASGCIKRVRSGSIAEKADVSAGEVILEIDHKNMIGKDDEYIESQISDYAKDTIVIRTIPYPFFVKLTKDMDLKSIQRAATKKRRRRRTVADK